MRKITWTLAVAAAFVLIGAPSAAFADDAPVVEPAPVVETMTIETNGGGHDPVTFCHKPGEQNQQELTTDDDGFLQGHLGHGDTLGACPELEPEVPEQPAAEVTAIVSTPVVDCDTDLVTVTTVTTTTAYVWDGKAWVLGEPVSETTTATTPTTLEQCPIEEPEPVVIDVVPAAPTFVDECGVALDDVILPPATEEYSYRSIEVSAGTHVLNDATVWVALEEGYVFSDAVLAEFPGIGFPLWDHSFTIEPCPVVVVPTVPSAPALVTPVTVDTAAPAAALAETGADPAPMVWFAALLVAFGAALTVYRLRTLKG